MLVKDRNRISTYPMQLHKGDFLMRIMSKGYGYGYRQLRQLRLSLGYRYRYSYG